jgi:catechol 2,3-dioxygenase-like lactoylglutathione lyase family enzyme
MSYRPSKPITLVVLLAAVAIVVVLAMRWRSASGLVPRTAQDPPVDCTTDLCRAITKTISTDNCYPFPATDPGVRVYIENDDAARRTMNVQVTQWVMWPGHDPYANVLQTQTLSPGPAGKWNPGCTQYFDPTPLPQHEVFYQYFVTDVSVYTPTPPGGSCPQQPFAIPTPPPFPNGAPTTKLKFRLKSPLTFNTRRSADGHGIVPVSSSRVFIEFDTDGNFILQDDRNTDGEHLTFNPDPNGHTYEIAAPNGRMMYQHDESGGELDGVFPGGVTPPDCLFHLGKKAWVLEPVNGSTTVFFIRNQATGDRLQVDYPHSSFGDKPTLHGPTGNLPEQWELVP